MDNLIGQRLKELRKRFGMTQKELAERAGVEQTTVSAAETGVRKPNRSTLILLSQGLGLPFPEMDAFLSHGKPITTTIAAPRATHHAHHPPRFIPEESARRIPSGTIPVTNEVPAGDGAMTNQEYFANFSHETVDAGPWASPGSQAFFIHGHSMSGKYEHGDLVVGDPTVPVDPAGCYAIVQFGPERDEKNCVRFVKHTGKGVLLKPSNKAFPEELIEDTSIIRLMLRIVEHRRPESLAS